MQTQVAINQLLSGMRMIQLDIGWQKIPQWQQLFVVESAEDIMRLHQHGKSIVIECYKPTLKALNQFFITFLSFFLPPIADQQETDYL